MSWAFDSFFRSDLTDEILGPQDREGLDRERLDTPDSIIRKRLYEHPAVFPTYWQSEVGCEKLKGPEVFATNIQPQTVRYDEIQNLVYENMKLPMIPELFPIKSIQQIQCKPRRIQYIVQRDMIINKPNKSGERLMFHGTTDEKCESIIEHGFNRSFCGKNGTVYGKGVYFSPVSSVALSVQYAMENEKLEKCLLLCYVAAGDTYRDKSLPRDLPAPPMYEGKQYDSTGSENGDIVCVFNDNQAVIDAKIVFDMTPLCDLVKEVMKVGITTNRVRDILVELYIRNIFNEEGGLLYSNLDPLPIFKLDTREKIRMFAFMRTDYHTGTNVLDTRAVGERVVYLLSYVSKRTNVRIIDKNVFDLVLQEKNLDDVIKKLVMVWDHKITPESPLPVQEKVFGRPLKRDIPATSLTSTGGQVTTSATTTTTSTFQPGFSYYSSSGAGSSRPRKRNPTLLQLEGPKPWISDDSQKQSFVFVKEFLSDRNITPREMLAYSIRCHAGSIRRFFLTCPHIFIGKLTDQIPTPLCGISKCFWNLNRYMYKAQFPLGVHLAASESHRKNTENKMMIVPYFVSIPSDMRGVDAYPGYTYVPDGSLGAGYYLDTAYPHNDQVFFHYHRVGNSRKLSHPENKQPMGVREEVRALLEKLMDAHMIVPDPETVQGNETVLEAALKRGYDMQYAGNINYTTNIDLYVRHYKEPVSCLSVRENDFHIANFPVGVEKIAPKFKEASNHILFVPYFAPYLGKHNNDYVGYTYRENGALGTGYYLNLKHDYNDPKFSVWIGSMCEHLVCGDSPERITPCHLDSNGKIPEQSWARYTAAVGDVRVELGSGAGAGAGPGSGAVPGDTGVHRSAPTRKRRVSDGDGGGAGGAGAS